MIGEAGKRLHTARSRNGQVATDFRLWVRGAIDSLDAALRDYQAALLDRAGEHAATAMPGFTHLQPAQPVTLGHHLLAYVEMAGRDRGRFRDARARLNECPLGAAALAGTSFPVDRRMTAAALGFDRPMANSIDAVSDRDFALEALAAAAIASGHLSRLAEETVVWSSAGFRLVALSEAFTTGSSIMPQKRNPDAAELVRAKTGRTVGALTALLTTMKGLPLAYSKDMQEDKEPVFDSLDTLGLCVRVMTGMVRDMTVDKERMSALAGDGYATATDLADWLVRSLDMPFRRAHAVVGRIVRRAEAAGCALEDLPRAAFHAEETAYRRRRHRRPFRRPLHRRPRQRGGDGAGAGARGRRRGAGALPVTRRALLRLLCAAPAVAAVAACGRKGAAGDACAKRRRAARPGALNEALRLAPRRVVGGGCRARRHRRRGGHAVLLLFDGSIDPELSRTRRRFRRPRCPHRLFR